jgi:LPXTG-motif cell wall-anchored protein
MTTSGDVVLSLPAGAAEDGAANLSEASTSADNTVTWQAQGGSTTTTTTTSTTTPGSSTTTPGSSTTSTVVGVDGSTTVPAGAAFVDPASRSRGASLPVTGSSSRLLVVLGGALLVLGAVFVLVARRRAD